MSSIIEVEAFDQAGSGSVVRMLPGANDTHAYYADYDLAALAVDALATRSPVHISGPSGTGKSHFLSALLLGPKANFECICSALDLPRWSRIRCHRLHVLMYETPAEVWYRTGVVNFSTEEQPQQLLQVLAEAAGDPEALHVVWLVESGRGISESVQGAFLEVVGQDTVREPRGRTFELTNCTFVTDSNHAANHESREFAIFDLDQAYGRRWTRRLSFDGLAPAQETAVLAELTPQAPPQRITQVVDLATGIRQRQSEGGLRSILPPTIDGELDLLGALCRLQLDPRTLVFSTMLGHCAAGDRDEAEGVFAAAFGISVADGSAAAEAAGTV